VNKTVTYFGGIYTDIPPVAAVTITSWRGGIVNIHQDHWIGE